MNTTPAAAFPQSLHPGASVRRPAPRNGRKNRSYAERMEVSPMREVECAKKSLPPLSQSRHGDMACETVYVQRHVQGAIWGESEPAARGIEIHQVLATYINHLVRTGRATDLEVFD